MKFDLNNMERVIADIYMKNNPDINPFDDKIMNKLDTQASEVGFEVLQYN